MKDTSEELFLGDGTGPALLKLEYANRHGLIAGATGTGKTVTVQVLCEAFSRAGVPTFVADVKGDLAGLAASGKPHPKIDERIEAMSLEGYEQRPYPVCLWDLFGEDGHQIRASVSDMGPLILARILRLNDTQEGVLNIAFALADDEGLPLLDFDDLRALLIHVGEHADELSLRYGNVASASVGAIQRSLLTLQQQGGKDFIGEPALNLLDLMRVSKDGQGVVNLLAAHTLIQNPRLYASFLLWLMSELFEELPEAGDDDKPKLVFFFDEAHLLFRDAPRALVERIEQVARLIRSKGVGLYFITQNPGDVPGTILGQLGNRVQHALRAYTPADRKFLRAAAESFRPNEAFDTETVLTELGIGEALVSTLEKKGIPGIVQRCLIRPPETRMGPISEDEREDVIEASPLGRKYDQAIDRESASEILQARLERDEEPEEEEAYDDGSTRVASRRGSRRISGTSRRKTRVSKTKSRTSSRQTTAEAATKALVRSLSSSIGRELGKSLSRGLFGSRRR